MSCTTLPNPLGIIIVVFSDHGNLLPSQESRIKTNTKLSNQVQVASFDSFNELGCARFGNSSQVLNEVILRHTNTCVCNSDSLGLSIKLQTNS
jgi:hypothetical protein